MKKFLKEYSFVPIVLIVMILIFRFVLQIGYIPSSSMEPSIMKSDAIFSTKIVKDINHKDVITFYSPLEDSDNEVWVKRVIGLAGDKIEFKNNEVYLNDKLLNENYVNTNEVIKYDDAIYNVPKDKIFLMGDNRNHSLDSRFWKDPYLNCNNVLAKKIYNINLKIVS